MLKFEMCLCGPAKCWYLTLSDIIKKHFESLTEQFNHDYLQNNQWLNTTRLENRKLLNTESAKKYISNMSDLALLVGIGGGRIIESSHTRTTSEMACSEFQPYYVE